jgi:outer membrane protein TolC
MCCAQTNMANAELQLEKASDLADLSEEQVRIALHVGEEQRLVPGEPLEGRVPALPPDVQLLTREALTGRPELKSVDASILALEKQVAIARAGYLPVLSGFGDYVYANPNERRFPPTSDWTATWDLGVRLTWSPNDVVVASATAREALARAASVRAQKGKLRDGIELEVTQAWLNARQADQAIITSQQELDSASEAYRVARHLFINGRATSTTLTDAETELTRSRLDLLNARADARIARVNLDTRSDAMLRCNRSGPMKVTTLGRARRLRPTAGIWRRTPRAGWRLHCGRGPDPSPRARACRGSRARATPRGPCCRWPSGF